jgi:signal transduction histidine kinase
LTVLRRRFPFTAPFRAALVSVIFSLIVALPVLMFVYHQTNRLMESRTANRIDDRERNLLLGYQSGGVRGLRKAIEEEIASGVARGGAELLVDPAGRKIAGNLVAWPPTLREPTRWSELRLYAAGEARAQLYALRVLNLPAGHRLIIGTNLEDRERMREALVEALFGAMIFAFPLGVLLGLVVLRLTERRARKIGAVAARIAAGDFSQRVDDRSEGEAFSVLAFAINGMLERMEELVEQLRIVTDALAHDLRSPLTRIRANVERAASRAKDDDQQGALEAVSTDVDRMLRLISATLEISRAEAGVGRQNFAEFDVTELLQGICEIYHPVAEERGVSLEVEESGPIAFLGNRHLIGQAVANLVDNSLKYASGGENIRLGSRREDGEVRLWVADEGPGIPPELRQDALRKYRRLDEARTTEGSGLGLAFVRSVARLHNGDIALEDNKPGLRVVMILRQTHELGGTPP